MGCVLRNSRLYPVAPKDVNVFQFFRPAFPQSSRVSDEREWRTLAATMRQLSNELCSRVRVGSSVWREFISDVHATHSRRRRQIYVPLGHQLPSHAGRVGPSSTPDPSRRQVTGGRGRAPRLTGHCRRPTSAGSR